MVQKETYDVIIVGAGVAGMAAAMYAARLGLQTLCLGASSSSELPVGGVITTTNVVENYLGFIRVTGSELATSIEQHARSYDTVTLRNERVQTIEKEDKLFTISTKKTTYHAKALIIATGTKWRQLDIPGSKEFENKGVAYCALCDAILFKGKKVCVIGGSDSAVKDALVLSEHAEQVFIIYRGEKLRAEPINTARVQQRNNIAVVTQTNVTSITGEKKVASVVLDKAYQGSHLLAVEGVFVAIGHVVLSELAEKLGVRVNEKKEIIINHKTSETSMPGVFAAGDVADKPFKQAITGVAEGCTAAYSAYEYITKQQVAE